MLTRYTELRHAGYYTSGLTDHERDTIAAQVDGTAKPKSDKAKTTSSKTTPKSSTTTANLKGIA